MLRTLVVCGHFPAGDVHLDTEVVRGLIVVCFLTDLLYTFTGTEGGAGPALQGRYRLP